MTAREHAEAASAAAMDAGALDVEQSPYRIESLSQIAQAHAMAAMALSANDPEPTGAREFLRWIVSTKFDRDFDVAVSDIKNGARRIVGGAA